MATKLHQNLAGIVALTGLAFTLACGGGDNPSNNKEPNPIPSGLSVSIQSPGSGITKHRYLVTANPTSIQVAGITYFPSSTPAAEWEQTEPNVWFMTPITRGNHNIEVVGRTSSGGEVRGNTGFDVMENTLPTLPASVRNKIQLPTQQSTELPGFYPFIDVDGDTVTWRVSGGTFITNKGTASINDVSANLRVDSIGIIAPGSYRINLQSVEKGKFIKEEGILTDFQVNVDVGFFLPVDEENELPELAGDFNTFARAGFSGEVKGDVLGSGWKPNTTFTLSAADGLVLKSSSAGSYDLKQVIDLSHLYIKDKDLQYGDQITVRLENITRNTISGQQLPDSIKSYMANNGELSLTVSKGPDPASDKLQYVRLGNLTFNTTPTIANLTGGSVPFDPAADVGAGDSISFNYVYRDLTNKNKDGSEAEPRRFSIVVPVKKNQEPSIDGKHYTDGTPADLPPTPSDEWAGVPPTWSYPTIWNIENSLWPASKALAYQNRVDKLTLRMIPVSMDGGVWQAPLPVVITDGFRPNTGIWRIEWTPNQGQNGKEYYFTLQAFNEYGAASAIKDMKGLVRGNIQGKNVSKGVYYDGKAVLMPADFSTFASVLVDPFFYIGFGKNENSYDREVNNPPSYEGGRDTADNNWKADGVPPKVSYLVSPSTRFSPTSPVIGLPLISTDGNSWDKSGKDAWSYAYINSREPDLTAHFALPARAASRFDGSISKDGVDTEKYVVGLDGDNPIMLPAIDALSASTINFTINSVGAGSFRSGYDAVQITVPEIGQTAFINPGSSYGAGDSPYPAADYPATFGWSGKLGLTSGTPDKTGDSALNFTNFIVNFADILPFKTNGETVVMSSMFQREAPITYASTRVNLPFWRLDRSGLATTKIGADTSSTFTMAAATFPTSPVFNAPIHRKSFADLLPNLIGTRVIDAAADELPDLRDTLQVVAYTHGTALGPMLFDQSAPVLLEFGNLTRSLYDADPVSFPLNFMAQTGLASGATLNFGSLQVPRPAAAAWEGLTTPVVKYIVRYAAKDTLGLNLPGSMGVVTETISSTSGIAMALRPVTNVRVSSAKSGGSAPSTSNTVAISATNGTSPGGKYGTVTAQAEPWSNVDDGEKKVYLTWTNPGVEFSGNIIEFFKWEYDANQNSFAPSQLVSDKDVPLYKVHVSPQINQFPIPKAWLAKLDASGGKKASFIVRIRTVKYGEGSSMVNFDSAPYKQALPATWVDTMTSWVSRDAASAPSGQYNDWWNGLTIAPPELELSKIGEEYFLAGAKRVVNFEGWTAPGSDVTHKNNDGEVPAYTWSVTSGGASIDAPNDGQSAVVVVPSAPGSTFTIKFNVDWKGHSRSWSKTYTVVDPASIEVGNVTAQTKVMWDNAPQAAGTFFEGATANRVFDASTWYGQGTKLDHITGFGGTPARSLDYKWTSSAPGIIQIVGSDTANTVTLKLADAAKAGDRSTITFAVTYKVAGSPDVTLIPWTREYIVANSDTPWADGQNTITIEGWPLDNAFTQEMADYHQAGAITWTGTQFSTMHQQVSKGYPRPVIYRWFITDEGDTPFSNVAEVTNVDLVGGTKLGNIGATISADTAGAHAMIPKPVIQIASTAKEGDKFKLGLAVTIEDGKGQTATNRTVPKLYTLGAKQGGGGGDKYGGWTGSTVIDGVTLSNTLFTTAPTGDGLAAGTAYGIMAGESGTITLNATGFTAAGVTGLNKANCTYLWEISKGGITVTNATTANASINIPVGVTNGDEIFTVTLKVRYTGPSGDQSPVQAQVWTRHYRVLTPLGDNDWAVNQPISGVAGSVLTPAAEASRMLTATTGTIGKGDNTAQIKIDASKFVGNGTQIYYGNASCLANITYQWAADIDGTPTPAANVEYGGSTDSFITLKGLGSTPTGAKITIKLNINYYNPVTTIDLDSETKTFTFMVVDPYQGFTDGGTITGLAQPNVTGGTNANTTGTSIAQGDSAVINLSAVGFTYGSSTVDPDSPNLTYTWTVERPGLGSSNANGKAVPLTINSANTANVGDKIKASLVISYDPDGAGPLAKYSSNPLTWEYPVVAPAAAGTYGTWKADGSTVIAGIATPTGTFAPDALAGGDGSSSGANAITIEKGSTGTITVNTANFTADGTKWTDVANCEYTWSIVGSGKSFNAGTGGAANPTAALTFDGTEAVGNFTVTLTIKYKGTDGSLPAKESVTRTWYFSVADSYNGWTAGQTLSNLPGAPTTTGFTGANTNFTIFDIEQGDAGQMNFDASGFSAGSVNSGSSGITYAWTVAGAAFDASFTPGDSAAKVNVTAANTATSGSTITVTLTINYKPTGTGPGRNSETKTWTFTVVDA
jgi:hypothetical protein